MSTGQKNRMQARPGVAPAPQKPEDLVSQYPMSSVLVVFGIGLGVGVALGEMLAGPMVSRPTFGHRTELAAEKLGRQMLEAIAGVLPDSFAKHLS